MQRGEVFWFEPDPVLGSEQAGRRPAIVLTRDAVNSTSPVIIVVPLTTYRGQSWIFSGRKQRRARCCSR
jgi:mRNA interferase MazF